MLPNVEFCPIYCKDITFAAFSQWFYKVRHLLYGIVPLDKPLLDVPMLPQYEQIRIFLSLQVLWHFSDGLIDCFFDSCGSLAKKVTQT